MSPAGLGRAGGEENPAGPARPAFPVWGAQRASGSNGIRKRFVLFISIVRESTVVFKNKKPFEAVLRALSRFLRSPLSPGPFLPLFSPPHVFLRGRRSVVGSGTALSIFPSLGKGTELLLSHSSVLSPPISLLGYFLKVFLTPVKTSGPKDCSFRSLAR